MKPIKSASSVATVALAIAALAGCSSHLVVTSNGVACKRMNDPGCKRLAGLPLPVAKPYIEFYAHTSYSKGGACTKVVKYRHIILPDTQEQRYVTVLARPFAESSLTVKYNDRGVVSEVTYGSTPSADMAGAATTAASTLLPYLGIVAAQVESDKSASLSADARHRVEMLAEAEDVGQRAKAELRDLLADLPQTLPACDSGEELIKVVRRTANCVDAQGASIPCP